MSALLIDGQLHDQLRMLILVANEREYAQRHPLVGRSELGVGAYLGDFIGLLAEFLGSAGGLAVDDDVAADAGDVVAVVVGDRLCYCRIRYDRRRQPKWPGSTRRRRPNRWEPKRLDDRRTSLRRTCRDG